MKDRLLNMAKALIGAGVAAAMPYLTNALDDLQLAVLAFVGAVVGGVGVFWTPNKELPAE